MTPDTQVLIVAALALPEAERVLLVERLLESLPPETEELSDEALLAELDRRRAEVEQGVVKPIPWSEFQFGT